jgi:hypothetical protein
VASVSMTVTSHAALLPACQGTSVIPSGRFPSVRNSPAGSFTADTPALTSARWMMSLRLRLSPSDSHAHSIVVKAKAARGDWECVQPVHCEELLLLLLLLFSLWVLMSCFIYMQKSEKSTLFCRSGSVSVFSVYTV